MTRPLLIIIALGFVTSLVCFSMASAMGGMNFRHWDWDRYDNDDSSASDGPDVTRTIAWTGDDELTVNLLADIEYTQGTDAKILVTGPKGAVDRVVLRGDRLEYTRRVHNGPRLKVVMTAPAVSDFTLNGSQRLNITGFDRSKLEVAIHGSGKVKAAGRANRMEVHIAGSGDADFGQLKTTDAEVDIAGSGDTIIAATGDAEINIAGSGDVTLATRPARVNTHIAGSGRIIQQDPAAAAPAAPATPAPPAAQAKPADKV